MMTVVSFSLVPSQLSSCHLITELRIDPTQVNIEFFFEFASENIVNSNYFDDSFYKKNNYTQFSKYDKMNDVCAELNHGCNKMDGRKKR